MAKPKRQTIIDEDAEHVRAAYWRRRIMLLKVAQLADTIGWSWRQIYAYEAGNPQPPEVWQRYKWACAGAHAVKYGWTKGRIFDWRL